MDCTCWELSTCGTCSSMMVFLQFFGNRKSPKAPRHPKAVQGRLWKCVPARLTPLCWRSELHAGGQRHGARGTRGVAATVVVQLLDVVLVEQVVHIELKVQVLADLVRGNQVDQRVAGDLGHVLGRQVRTLGDD